MVEKPKKKINKLLYLIHLVWILPLLGIAWLIWSEYHRANIEPATSAKPQAEELLPYIEQSGGTILHTYNRSAKGFPGTVSSPSYEFYIDYSDTNLKKRAEEISAAIAKIGYKTQYTMYIAADGCKKYDYNTSSLLPSGQSATETSIREYCKNLTGTDNKLLFGSTENENEPYYTVYGERGTYTVFAEITNKTFRITSNDFWREEYAKKYNVPSEAVRIGHTIVTVTFDRK